MLSPYRFDPPSLEGILWWRSNPQRNSNILSRFENPRIMNTRKIDKIVKALLYEGYLLYPYRASAIKNRYRWNFGSLYPERYVEKRNLLSQMQTECIVQGKMESLLEVTVRF